MKLLVFCLSAIYLAFRGLMYQQTYGTAMGSIANLVMEDVEERTHGNNRHPVSLLEMVRQ